MKRTRNMIYKETQESRELFLYAVNSGELYQMMIESVIKSLRKKAIKGTYENEKAVDAYYRVACKASEMYKKDFGYSFSVQDRFTVAVEMESYYREDNIFYELEAQL